MVQIAPLRRLFGSLLLFLIAFPVFPLGKDAQADEKDLDSLAHQLAKVLAKAKVKKVAAVEFTGANGESSPMGKFLADRVLEGLGTQKHGFELLGREALRKRFPEIALTSVTLKDKEVARSVSNFARAVITGLIVADANAVIVRVTAVDTSGGKELGRYAVKIPRAFLPDDLPPEPHELTIYTVGKDGVSYPQCIYCPNPSYSDAARSAKLEGNVLLQVVVTAEGRASQIMVAKIAGHGLDEVAIAAVRNWKFKPAMKDGSPVAVQSVVEVTFRLL